MKIDINNKFFKKNLINIAFKNTQNIKKFKIYNLIFKKAISGLKNCFFLSFSQILI